MGQTTADRPNEKSRRVIWRVVTIGLFLVIATGVWLLATENGWNDKVAVFVVAMPYWLVVAVLWKRYGPYLPDLHDTESK